VGVSGRLSGLVAVLLVQNAPDYTVVVVMQCFLGRWCVLLLGCLV
jgi:hypothetical protein